MQLPLAGTSALVTGAARRIGAAIARELHAAGASVMLHYRGSDAEARAREAAFNAARPGSVAIVAGDLAEPGGEAALVEATLARFGRLDLLVNNASNFYATPFGSVDPRQWDELMGANLRAPFFLAQAAAPALRPARGAIVNIIDIHADRPLAGYPVYSIAKAGLASLTKSLAIELAPDIRVNGVAPGAIAWPDDGQLDPQERERIVGTTPLARTGSPEDIAQAVRFLATAPFVTGQILAVDGGRSVFI